ncbi:hypothetical protein [Streptomyces sp. NPDC091209]|uniref:hypothetical protein n=1 Tax=Streptomyces sp. NPDC091209 TaxID=3365974 RepID=UPI003806020F
MPTGALLYHSVAAESHLCCVTRADLLGELIPRLAEGIVDLRPALSHHLGAQRSFPSRYTRPEPPSADRTPSPVHEVPDTDRPNTSGKATEGTAYTVDQTAGADDVPTATRDLLCEALGVHGLHYLAYYTGGAPTCRVDLFAHSAVQSFLGSSTAEQRRDRYSLLGQLLPGVTGRMNTSLNALLEGEMRQIVLNIERGAVYFQQLPEHCYLLGVSLDQSHLAEADRHIERLSRELASE